MSQIRALIQRYRDGHGQVAEAAIARSAGIEPGTLNSWFRRGRTSIPAAPDLYRLTRAIEATWSEMLDAALHDYGYLPEEGVGHDRSASTKSPDTDSDAKVIDLSDRRTESGEDDAEATPRAARKAPNVGRRRRQQDDRETD